MTEDKGIISYEQVGIIMGAMTGGAIVFAFAAALGDEFLTATAVLCLLPIVMIGMPLILIDLFARMMSTNKYEAEVKRKSKIHYDRIKRLQVGEITMEEYRNLPSLWD